jgi:predicted nucleotidyltransferase
LIGLNEKIKMVEKIEHLLERFVDECNKRFGADLVSIILFGSYARDKAKKYFDIDLLVVARNLPEDWRERDRILDDLEFNFLKKYHKRIFPIIVTPEAVIDSVRGENPLFYGILTGYKILFDKDNFFDGALQEVRARVRIERPIFYDKVGRWDLAEV